MSFNIDCDVLLDLLEQLCSCNEEWLKQNLEKLSCFIMFGSAEGKISTRVSAIRIKNMNYNQLVKFFNIICNFNEITTYTFYDCSLHPEHMEEFIKLTGTHKVKRLYISNCNFCDNSFQLLCNFLSTQRKLARITLKNLSLPYSKVCFLRSALDQLKTSFSLSHLTFTNNNFDDDSWEAIIPFFAPLKGVHVLNLSNNNFSSKIVILLAKYICLMQTLQHLVLDNNKIGYDNVIKILCKSLKQCKVLKRLILDYTGLNGNHFKCIIKAISRTNISGLSVRSNYIDSGVLSLFNKNLQLSLEVLDLSSNHISRDVFIEFSKELRTTVNFSILQILYLEYNNINDEIATYILEAYVSTKKIGTLDFRLDNNNVSQRVIDEFHWVGSINDKNYKLENYPVVNLTMVGYFDQDNFNIAKLIKKTSKKDVGQILKTETSIVSRDPPMKLSIKSSIAFSLITLHRANFLRYYSLICGTTSRLIFIVSGNPSKLGYIERLSYWISFLASVEKYPFIIISLYIEDLSNIQSLYNIIEQFITLTKFKYGDKIYLHDDPIYFNKSEKNIKRHVQKKKNPFKLFENVLEDCGKRMIQLNPIYLPVEVVNYFGGNTRKSVHKMMLKDKILSNLKILLGTEKNFEVGEIFRKLVSSRLLIPITKDRICTDLSWFYQAVINSLLDPDTIRSNASSIEIVRENYFVSEAFLRVCPEFIESGINFPGLIGYICSFLEKTNVWHKMCITSDVPLYFHTLMLPSDNSRGNFDSQLFAENGFILRRRLVPAKTTDVIPPIMFPSLQYMLYEILCENNTTDFKWKFFYSKSIISFSFSGGGGFRICIPCSTSADEFHLSNSFLDIDIISPTVTGATTLHSSIMALVDKIMKDNLIEPNWKEFALSYQDIYNSGTLKLNSSNLKETTEILIKRKTYKNAANTIPDILSIDPRKSQVSYLLQKYNILLIKVILYDITGKLRNIPFDTINVFIFNTNTKQLLSADLYEYKSLEGEYYYSIYIDNIDNSILICSLMEYPMCIGNTPIPLGDISKDDFDLILQTWSDYLPQYSPIHSFNFYDTQNYIIDKRATVDSIIQNSLTNSNVLERSNLLALKHIQVNWYLTMPMGLCYDAVNLCELSYNIDYKASDAQLQLTRAINNLKFQRNSKHSKVAHKICLFSSDENLGPFGDSCKLYYFFFIRKKEFYVTIRASTHNKDFQDALNTIFLGNKSKNIKKRLLRRSTVITLKNCIYNCADVILQSFIRHFKVELNNPIYKSKDIHITGHSIGGAIATAFSHVLHNSTRLNQIKRDGNINIRTFGSLLTENEEDNTYLNSPTIHVANFVIEKDPICSFTLRDLNWENVGIQPLKYTYTNKLLYVFEHFSTKIRVIQKEDVIQYLKNCIDITSIENTIDFNRISLYKSAIINLNQQILNNEQPDDLIFDQ